MRKILQAAVAVGALALVGSALATPGRAQNWEDVEIRTVDVAPGLHMLIGRGGNIGVSSGNDGVFLVDDQFAPLTEKIVAAIRGFSDAPIRFLINTHWHGDHTGGNENLGGAGALIVAHENVRKRLSVEQLLNERTIPPRPRAALPVITFTRDLTFHLNGDELHAFHVENAHTDGDAVIVFRRANAVHMGDVYFAGMYPFIDIEHGGSTDGMIAAVDRVLAMIDDDTKIIPGHGPLSNKAELQAYRDMLVSVRRLIAAEIEAGKTLDEVISANPTAPYDAEWATRFITPERFTRIIYTDLSSN